MLAVLASTGGCPSAGGSPPSSTPPPPSIPPPPLFCSVVDPQISPANFRCLDVPGAIIVGVYGPARYPNENSLDACFGGAVPSIVWDSTRDRPAGNIHVSYSARARIGGGANLSLNQLLRWLPNVSFNASSETTVSVDIIFRNLTVRPVQNLRTAFDTRLHSTAEGSEERRTAEGCRRALCNAGTVFGSRALIGRPSITIRTSNGSSLNSNVSVGVSGDAGASPLAGFSFDTSRSGEGLVELTSEQDLVVGIETRESRDALDDLCQLVIEGNQRVEGQQTTSGIDCVMRNATVDMQPNSSWTLNCDRLRLEGASRIVGVGQTGANGSRGAQAFFADANGTCRGTCIDARMINGRCVWNNSRSDGDFQQALNSCRTCGPCMCGQNGDPAGNGGPGPSVTFRLAHPPDRAGSISVDLRGGPAGTPGDGGTGAGVQNHGGDVVACNDGRRGASANEGPRGTCRIMVGETETPCS